MKKIIIFLFCLLCVSCLKLGEKNEWDNPLDPDGDNWHPPEVTAMDDTSIAIKSDLLIKADGYDAKEGYIIHYLWSFDHGKTWSDTSSVNSTKKYFPKSSAGVNIVWVVAIDNDTLLSKPDSVAVEVKLFKPTVVAMNDTLVAVKDTIVLHAKGSDENGSIVMYLWSINDTSSWNDTSDASGTLNKYFLPESSGINKVFVKVLDDDSIASEPDSFSVDVRLYMPVVTVDEEAIININDSLEINAEGSDTNGTVEFYLWALDGTNFTDTTNDGTITTAFDKGGLNPVRVVAVDDDDIISQPATANITVTLDPPIILEKIEDKNVSNFDLIEISVSAVDTNATGSIEKYYWDNDGDGWDDSTNSPDYFILPNFDTTVNFIWGARDDDSQIGTDTFQITYSNVKAAVEMTTPINNATTVFRKFDPLTGTGSVALQFHDTFPDNDGKMITYTLFLGKSGSNQVKVYEGNNTAFIKDGLKASSAYEWKLMAKDQSGTIVQNTGQFKTPDL